MVPSTRSDSRSQIRTRTVGMRRIAYAASVALLGAAGAVAIEFSAHAQAVPQQLGLGQVGAGQTGAGIEIPVTPPAASLAPDARVQVLIELTEEPGAVSYARVLAGVPKPDAATRTAAANAARVQIDRVDAQQATIMGRIAAAGVQPIETFRVKRAMNGIAATVINAQIATLNRLPGVKAVHVIEAEYPTNSSSVPFIGAPPVWNDSAGVGTSLTGAGIRIGIIDTGIDYQHADFGGTGQLTDYQANDRTAAPDAYFPSAKVVGGWDFAGDAYTGGNAPSPDADPMDCNGHGTHVAGTAAGMGVNNDGTTYTGPYGPSTPFSSLRIGPGVAPQATLYALRVFGCTGSTNLTVQAIDWAMDPNNDSDLSDHLDVINMSLGSNFGSLASTSAIAADNAVAAGVIVVTSAGNSGDTFFIGGSPGAGNRVISTAATGDSGIPGPGLHVNAPGVVAGDYVAGTASFGPPPPPTGITGNVVLADDPNDGAGPLTTDGCSPLTNAAAIAGNIAFIDRGTCGFSQKTKNAQDAGAIAVIIANSSGGVFGNLGGSDPTITIPTVMITFADGNTLRAQIGAPLNVTLSNGADTVASFSSRGPRIANNGTIQLKPDISAPGLAITSAQTGVTCTAGNCQRPDASGFVAGSLPLILQGTSMACPHITGVMALLRQLHPDWSVEELKALAMNNALHDLWQFPGESGLRYNVSRIGSGRVDVPLAAKNSVIAFNADDPGQVSVSFDGAVQGAVTRNKKVRLVNHGTTDQTYDLAFDTVVDAPGVSYGLPGGSTVTVPAGQSVDLTLSMAANASQMDHSRDPIVSATQVSPAPLAALGSLPRSWITEEGAYLTFSQGGTLKLRVPLYAAARPESAMSAPSTIVTGGAPTGTTTIPLSGTDVCTGTLGAGPTCTGSFPNDEVSLVTPFELQIVSPPSPATAPGYADIQYAGVAYSSGSDQFFFGISTYEPWTTPNQVTFNVYIDNNNDGTWDRILFAADPSAQASFLFGTSGVYPQDAFTSGVFNTSTSGVTIPSASNNRLNRVPPSAGDTRVFDNQVAFLAAPRTNLGISGAFRYKVVTCPGTQPLCLQLNGNKFDEAAGPYSWNDAAQGMDFGGSTLVFDLNGASLPVTWNTANMTTNGSLGALLLHHHNGAGMRAQVVPLDMAPRSDLSITLTTSNATPLPGSDVTLTYKVTNAGPSTASGVQALAELPSGVTYVSDDGGGTYDSSLGLWTIGSLANSASVTLHVTVKADAPGALAASANVIATSPIDPVSANNYAALGMNAPANTDLQITASAAASPIVAGRTGTFNLTVTNLGSQTAYNLNIPTPISAGGSLISGTPGVGVFDVPTGTWRIASLASGQSATLSIDVSLVTGPTVSVSSTLSSTTIDSVLANNTAIASIDVLPRATTTTMTIAPPGPTVTEPVTATITVTDTDTGGSASSPTGQVSLVSSLVGDLSGSPNCVLVPVPSTIQSACVINFSLGTGGTRTLTATYAGTTTHATSHATQNVDVTRMSTQTTSSSQTVPRNTEAQNVTLTATVSSTLPIDGGTVTFTLKDSGNVTVGTPVVSPALTSTGVAQVTYILPANTPGQTLTIVAEYSGTTTLAPSSDNTHTLTVLEGTFTYLLAEGATGPFFDTDILLANPNSIPVDVNIRFLKEDGTTVPMNKTLPATSRTTIKADEIAGLESASFSTVVTSPSYVPIVVERTMRWDSTGYGSHTEKASEGSTTDWYFAEGSQGFFHTYFLLVNPQSTPNTAHITYVLDDATTVTHDYTLPPTSRLTVDAASEPQLKFRSFGATVSFSAAGMAERAVYFNHGGELYAGGHASAGTTTPSLVSYLAEGATGSFFSTFVLIANPGTEPATASVRYLLDNGTEVTKSHDIGAHQRLTIDASSEDPTLAAAAFSTVVTGTRPLVVERSTYWPEPDWYEAHNSAAVAAPATRWGLAEGEVGGAGHTQTFILIANPSGSAADLTVTFLRPDGTTLVKTFNVGAGSRFNVSVAGAGSSVPELHDEVFGTVIESTQPIVVERSIYSNANGVMWASGTNATGTRLP